MTTIIDPNYDAFTNAENDRHGVEWDLFRLAAATKTLTALIAASGMILPEKVEMAWADATALVQELDAPANHTNPVNDGEMGIGF